MAWEVWWALVLGFLLSGIVQAWVPRSRLERALGGRGLRTVALATGLGAASSSCSYAAVAIAKSLFQKGASLASAMAFQFASTNLVFEIGIVIWIFLGWQFTLAEFVGRPAPDRADVDRRAALRLAARGGAGARRTRRPPRPATSTTRPGRGLAAASRSRRWSDVAHNFRGDWEMLWKEITAGFLIAGFIALLPMDFFNALFLTDSGGALQLIENVIVGPLVAVLSFVCSVGNIPLAAVLWAGGISFSGVIAFIYADLIIIPIVLIYRKLLRLARWRRCSSRSCSGRSSLAALVVDGIFSAVGLDPERASVDRVDHRARDHLELHDRAEHRLHARGGRALSALTVRRGARDPVCGMTVDRGNALSLEHGGNAVLLLRAWLPRPLRGRSGAVPLGCAGSARPRTRASPLRSGVDWRKNARLCRVRW